MTIREQIKAIKDCLYNRGWKYVNVKHLHTNQYSRTIKSFLVEFALERKEELTFSYTITDFSTCIDSVESKQIIFLDIINALNKALHN